MVGKYGWNPSSGRAHLSILLSPFPRRMEVENPLFHSGVKGKVLIVDDAPDTLDIIHKLLSFDGYEVITASSGEEGVKKVNDEKPDVVLMDLNLPGMNGTETLKRIREINPLQCVVMLTAFAALDNAIQALKLGAS